MPDWANREKRVHLSAVPPVLYWQSVELCPRNKGVTLMGLQIRELMDWVRRRKFFAGVLIVLTLAIGILIGTLISGRAMATRGQSAQRRHASRDS